MSNNELLPVPQNKIILPQSIKQKVVNISKYSLLTAGSAIATVASLVIAPVLSVPFVAILTYNGQKLLNNTVYKSYPDLAFITRRSHNNIKIFQDATRFDIANRINDYTDIEKAGFMQLQTIIGMSKFDKVNKNGNIQNFTTTSHGIVRKTFRKLEELGYIENYEEEYRKKARLILPKLAFGNFRALKDKVEMFDIKFNLSDNKIDITDPKLQRAFPMIFSKRGLLQKRGYNIVSDENENLTIEYTSSRDIKVQDNKKYSFKASLKGEITYEEQGKFIEKNPIKTDRQKDIDVIKD